MSRKPFPCARRKPTTRGAYTAVDGLRFQRHIFQKLKQYGRQFRNSLNDRGRGLAIKSGRKRDRPAGNFDGKAESRVVRVPTRYRRETVWPAAR